VTTLNYGAASLGAVEGGAEKRKRTIQLTWSLFSYIT